MSNVHRRRRPHNFKDLTGQRFSRLMVLRYHGRNASQKSVWWCRCGCGTEKAVQSACLLNGKTRSCGCLERELLARRNHERAVHGMTETPEWKAWKGMLDRCYNRADKSYRHYGGRGIRVCSEWRASFLAFYNHVGPRPSSGHSLDRYPDTNGSYEPGNVRWATPTEQNRNRRNVRRFLFRGRLRTIPELAEQTGLSPRLLWSRLVEQGWPVARATTQDPRAYHRGL
jgi:hypothetical protein